jgi:nucleolar protein 53
MFKKQLNKQDEAVKVKQENRQEKKAKAKFEPRRLSRKKFEGEEIPVPESTESLGNLRTVKPEGNVLVDRFKSLQKRNILAPNIKRMPRKRRLTTVKKNQHKEEVKAPLTKKQKKAQAAQQAMKINK